MPNAKNSMYLAWRYTFLSFSKLILLAFWPGSETHAVPLGIVPWLSAQENEDGDKPASDPSLWLYLGTAAVLVLLGGAFAGLTIALMGQDEVYLHVIRESGEGAEKKHADRVLRLLQKGKHWVLVTLLLSNVITNETLPIVLDRSLGGGWPAVLGSTVLIVIFGEIVPQSVCVRYGLPIGSWMAPFVLVLMYVLAPVAWPTAKLLDYLLGKDHGTIYKKAGLKTLVSLHKSMGEVGQQLNTDEVTIISAVLDLKDKSVGVIMTPMDDVFTLSLDDVLDESTTDDILSRGYSRIPIHHPDNDENFVGMLLVKMLITYDPEDAKPVRDFALATLPETRPDTSCLDIINFFQEGKSHMILVSEYPGEDHGAIGVVTLEDVIEELIGEEIVDESDVYIDVHKAIRRAIPAPRMRIPRGHVVEDPPSAAIHGDLAGIDEHVTLSQAGVQRSKTTDSTNQKPKNPTAARRRSSAASYAGDRRLPARGASTDLKEHLKHIGPSNLASRPKTTRFNTVKIKPGTEGQRAPVQSDVRTPSARRVSENATDYQGAIGEGVLSSGGRHASDGVQAVKAGHGALSGSPSEFRPSSVDKKIQTHFAGSDVLNLQRDGGDQNNKLEQPSMQATGAESTVGSLPERQPRSRSPYYQSRGPARSGSITENIIDTNGIRKVVLGTTSSSESNDGEDNSGADKSASCQAGNDSSLGGDQQISQESVGSHPSKKKKRRRKKQGQGPHDTERDAWDAHFQDHLAKARQEVASRTAAASADNKQLSADVAVSRAGLRRATAEDALNALAARDKIMEDLQAALSEPALVRQVKEKQQQQLRQAQQQAQQMQQLQQQELAAKKLVEEPEERQVREKDVHVSKLLIQEKVMAAIEMKSVELNSALAEEKDARVAAEAKVVELTKQSRTLQSSGTMAVDAAGDIPASDVQAQIEAGLREERAKWGIETKMVEETVASERELAAGFENAVAEIAEERLEELEATLDETRRERDSRNAWLEENLVSRKKLGIKSKRLASL
ncbi:hypothetical protein DV736_g4938, partial [Chaetothyriales sp. CBS 134916]